MGMFNKSSLMCKLPLTGTAPEVLRSSASHGLSWGVKALLQRCREN